MKKYNIFLDLDNTLISAVPTTEFPFDDKSAQKKAKLLGYEDMDDYYLVFFRPHLQNFLDFVFKHFNVCIWSAASKDYVLWIVKNIILKDHPEREIDYIFFSYHCNWSKSKKKNIKNLQMLWDDFGLSEKFNGNNTFIIDDLSDVVRDQPCNSIQIDEFEFTNKGSENDKELLRIKKRLKKLLKSDLGDDVDICLTTSF